MREREWEWVRVGVLRWILASVAVLTLGAAGLSVGAEDGLTATAEEPIATVVDQYVDAVACNLCGASNYEVIYPPRYEAADPGEIVNTFRSSGDEILVDQLVRCKQCGLQYLSPRLRQDLVLSGYSEGADEMGAGWNGRSEARPVR